MYRTREQIQEAAKLRPSASDWFRDGDKYDAVLNIQPTVNQILVRNVKKVVDKLPQVYGTRVKVQQGYGRSTLSSIMTRDIGTTSKCGLNECLVCTAPESVGDCRLQSVTLGVYKVTQ